MSARGGLLIAIVALGACGDGVVHIRFGEGAYPACPDSEKLVTQTWIVKAHLRVGSSGPNWKACVETNTQIWTLSDLEWLFRKQKWVFSSVPSEGPWALVVAGYPKEDPDPTDKNWKDTCVPPQPRTKAPVLCGMTAGDEFPPSDQLVVPIDCMPRLPGDYTAIKEKLKACAANVE